MTGFFLAYFAGDGSSSVGSGCVSKWSASQLVRRSISTPDWRSVVGALLYFLGPISPGVFLLACGNSAWRLNSIFGWWPCFADS